MSRFSRSIRDFFTSKAPETISIVSSPTLDRTSSGLAPPMDAGKRAATEVDLGPRKRRKLSPSPDTSTEFINEESPHEAKKAVVALTKKGVKQESSDSSPQHSPSLPSSSLDVLAFDGSRDAPTLFKPAPREPSAQRSESPTKSAAHPPPTSSLTTLPYSTQSSGSRRTTRNGEGLVLDSQSSEDSDDLLDLADLFSQRKAPAAPLATTAQAPNASKPSASRQTSGIDNGRSSRASDRLRLSREGIASPAVVPQPPEKKYRFSLDSIVKKSEKTARAQVKAKEFEDELEQQEKEWIKSADTNPLNENYLASVVEEGSDEEGKARRVVQAIFRTEVIEETMVWHFFDSQPSTVRRRPFPSSALPNQGWMSLLKDPTRRRRLFISGFATRMTQGGRLLPIEVYDWLLSELCFEGSDDLLFAYVEIITTTEGELRNTLTAARIQEMFEALGSRREGIDSHNVVHLEAKKSDESRQIPRRLSYVIRCLQALSGWLSQETRFYVLHVLARILLDEDVQHSGEYQLLISDAITVLVRNIPEDEIDSTLSIMGQMLFEAVPSPLLRARLISSLPCATPRAHLFRRRLAFAFALETPKHIEKPLTNRKLTDQVLVHLIKSPLFRISPDTDYKVLTVRFNMLDIAIDAGFSDFSFLQPLSPDVPKEDLDKQKEKEAKFNAGIDMLAHEILEIMARIVDSGMSSLRRTEAKAAAQRLQQRLECAVRTKERPAKDWFGTGHDVVRRDFMRKWFKKPEEGEEAGDASPEKADGEERPAET